MNQFKKQDQYRSDGKAAFMSSRALQLYKSNYLDSEKFNNIVLSQRYFRPLHSDLWENKNVLLFGDYRDSINRCFVKPNILQMNSSFVVIDIEGEILKDVGKVLQHHRYKIKVLNLLHPDHSHHYDPLHYCKSKYDIERLADCIINNTSVPSGSSDFDDETEKLLLCSCISHFVEEKQKNKEENFGTLCKTICEAAGSNEKREALYAILDSSPKSSNTHKYLEAFKICALWQGKVAFFDCLARLKQFLIKDYEELFSADELELEKIGKEKTALFVLTNQPEASTSKTLPSILYTQLFDTLYRISEERKVAQGYGFNLPIYMFMNNFGIVGRISDLPMRLKTCHTYNISISLVLPNILELRNIYKKDWRPIIDNCSIWNYFGGSDQETQEIMSDKLGYVLQTSKFFKNRHVTYPFMSPQEIDILPCDKCIVSALGLKPVLDYKFDYKKHSQYLQTAEANPDFAFDYRTLFN